MPARTSPTVRLRRLSAELRRLRVATAMSREDVAEHTGINPATLYRIEHAKVRPQGRTLAALLNLYEVQDERRVYLMQLLKTADQRSLLQSANVREEYGTYIEFESEARSIWNYESLFVPGLLQTEGYARAVISGVLPDAPRELVDERVAVRLARQDRLDTLQVWAIIDEAAVRRVVGGDQVRRQQLDHLLEVTEQPAITLQVLPFDVGAHPGMPGSFVVMDFETDPNLVYLDHLGGGLFLEEEDEVRRYTMLFDHLRAMALSPGATRDFLARARTD